jgi:hypothetical protein
VLGVNNISTIETLMSDTNSIMKTINDSYLIPNSEFQITVDKLLADFARTDLTNSDLQNKYDDFINNSNYKAAIKDANSGNGKSDANDELTAVKATLAAVRDIAYPPVIPGVIPAPIPPDPTVTNPTTSCGKAYLDSATTP